MLIGLQRGDLKMTSKQFNRYYCRQKDWWQNMNNCCINYLHMSEATLNLVHMSTPKQRIDRMNWFWMAK